MIVVKVRDRDIKAAPMGPVTTGSVGLPVSWHFSEEWDDLAKTAVFRVGNDGTEITVAVLEDLCLVPDELLVQANAGENLWIGVYGWKGTNANDTIVPEIAMPTIWTYTRIQDGSQPSGIEPPEGTPGWSAQIQNATDEALRVAHGVAADAAEGDFDGISPAVTIDSITHGHSVTITDRDHPTGQSFNVLDGDSAYEQAVEGGYTGTEAQFNEELASFKELSKQAADSAQQAASGASTAQYYMNSAWNAVNSANLAKVSAESAAAQALIRMNSADTSAQAAAETATTFTEQTVPAAVNTINEAKADAISAVGNAQTTAVGAVQQESTTQQAAIQRKGEDVLDSIPEDYTELTEDVADLKSAVTLYTGNAQINFVKDKYIVTSGSTVDITSPVNSSSGYGYAVIDCSEGDKFTVTSSGGQNPRAWCFIDASGNSLSKADANVAANNAVITAPANSANLVINAKYETEKSYYGEFLTNRVEDLSDAFENRDPLFNKIIKLPNNDSFFEGKPTNAGIYTKLGNNAFEISGGTGTTFYNYPIHGTKRVVVGTDAQTLARVLPEDFIEIPTGGDWRSTTFSLGIKMYIESTVSTGSVELVIICANIINGEFVDTPVVLARGQVNAKYGTCINRLRDTGFAPFEKYTHYAIFVRSKNRSTGNSTKIYLETVQSPRALSNTLNSASMVETSMKATRNYAVNSLIIIETKLYKVISAISSGEDIIVGTNVQETTILGTLTYLLNRI